MGTRNRTEYECECGVCHRCISRERAKNFYKAPKFVRERYTQKKISEEMNLMDMGYVMVNCPKCKQDRQVVGSTLKHGFSCDRCGYKTP